MVCHRRWLGGITAGIVVPHLAQQVLPSTLACSPRGLAHFETMFAVILAKAGSTVPGLPGGPPLVWVVNPACHGGGGGSSIPPHQAAPCSGPHQPRRSAMAKGTAFQCIASTETCRADHRGSPFVSCRFSRVISPFSPATRPAACLCRLCCFQGILQLASVIRTQRHQRSGTQASRAAWPAYVDGLQLLG